ncbi:MAG: VOC family protein [Chloroflexi bacterium]|nr:MAG: VOC family protein [Chloroflexota bacterium]
MPDFTQSAKGLSTPTVVDHVLLPVADLDDGARSLDERFGLKGIPGGRHPGVGTANVIVPLGRQYLELIAIVDQGEAASSRLGGRVARALQENRRFVAWALRTEDLDAVRARLQGAGWDLPAIVEGSRTRPDGQVLRWRTQDVDTGTEPSAIPFVIEWRIPDGLHPGEVESAHRTGRAALRRVVVGARDPRLVQDRLQMLLGDSDLYEVREAAVDGVQQVVLETEGGGELVIE